MNEPRTKRGEQTKAKLLAAAEAVFAEQGYQAASISRITERAAVAQGTFYLYFSSKLDLFEQLVEDLNRRVRKAMSDGAARGANRAEAEREGFREFFAFTAEHPALYRVVREAEYVSPGAMRAHYERIVDGYREGLTRAKAAGEIGDIDPEVAAWALMGVGEMIGMRYVLWPTGDAGAYGSGATPVPEHVFDEMVAFVQRALGTAQAAPAGQTTPEPTTDRVAIAAHSKEDS
jgi:AcrR family transcriptional regulator